MSQVAGELSFPRVCTLDEYLELAEQSVEKLEYFGGESFPLVGEVVAMAGGSPIHAMICANIGAGLHRRLQGKPCNFFTSDLRIGVRGFRTYSYTDGHVICGSVKLDDRDATGHTAMNPTVIIEVLSPSTERDDRGRKFQRYIQIESLQDYMLVAQDRASVEVISRHTDGNWLIKPGVGLDAVATLQSLNIQLPLAEIYQNVELLPELAESSGTVVPKEPG